MAKTILPATPAQVGPPTVYVDLAKSDVGELKGVKVGEKARVVITGKVLAITMRQDDKEKTGSLTIESTDVRIKDAPNSDMEDLMEEAEEDD